MSAYTWGVIRTYNFKNSIRLSPSPHRPALHITASSSAAAVVLGNLTLKGMSYIQSQYY